MQTYPYKLELLPEPKPDIRGRTLEQLADQSSMGTKYMVFYWHEKQAFVYLKYPVQSN